MIPGSGLWQLIDARAEQTPDALLAIDEAGRELGFRAFRDECERVAAGFFAMGVAADTPVSWIQPTRIEALVMAGALARIGAVQNPILPIYREREVGFVTRQTGARLLIVPGAFRGFDYAEMANTLAAQQSDLQVCDTSAGLPDGAPETLPPAPPVQADEAWPVRWIFYTSGTTSDPKGARHTDRTLEANSRGMSEVLDLHASDRIALVFPVTHIGGIGWLFAAAMSGCTLIVVEAFDAESSPHFLAKHGVTHAAAGTVFHQAYLAAQRKQPGEPLFPRVRCFPGGAAPKAPQLHHDLKAEMGGVGIVSGYGLTECPIIAMNSMRCPDEKLAHTEGRVNPPEAQIRVVKLDGTPAGPGEEGEIRVFGPQLCKGYVDAELDAAARDEAGFFRTGDLGYLDAEGYIVITGRLKDVIIRKGENISAQEIEDLLYTHPKVADVAVIGLPDPALGERACAVVQCNAGESLGFDEMVAFLKAEQLMVQKLPEQLELIDEIPRNPSGKILKKDLRERYGGSN